MHHVEIVIFPRLLLTTPHIVRIIRLRSDPETLVDMKTPATIGQFGSSEHLHHVSRICVEEEEQQLRLHLFHLGLNQLLPARPSIIRRHIEVHLVRGTASTLQRTRERGMQLVGLAGTEMCVHIQSACIVAKDLAQSLRMLLSSLQIVGQPGQSIGALDAPSAGFVPPASGTRMERGCRCRRCHVKGHTAQWHTHAIGAQSPEQLQMLKARRWRNIRIGIKIQIGLGLIGLLTTPDAGDEKLLVEDAIEMGIRVAGSQHKCHIITVIAGLRRTLAALPTARQIHQQLGHQIRFRFRIQGLLTHTIRRRTLQLIIIILIYIRDYSVVS